MFNSVFRLKTESASNSTLLGIGGEIIDDGSFIHFIYRACMELKLAQVRSHMSLTPNKSIDSASRKHIYAHIYGS